METNSLPHIDIQNTEGETDNQQVGDPDNALNEEDESAEEEFTEDAEALKEELAKIIVHPPSAET